METDFENSVPLFNKESKMKYLRWMHFLIFWDFFVTAYLIFEKLDYMSFRIFRSPSVSEDIPEVLPESLKINTS